MRKPHSFAALLAIACSSLLATPATHAATLATTSLPVTSLPATITLKEPAPTTYWITPNTELNPQTIEARRHKADGPKIWFGPRIVLQLDPTTPLDSILTNRPLQPLHFVPPDFHILDAGDALTALSQSTNLATIPGVISARPVISQNIQRHTLLAPRPNDPKYSQLWQLENRLADGTRRGPDLAAREAWSTTYGNGVTVAVADDGVELAHPDLAPAGTNTFHFNFTNGTTNALPSSSSDYHATLVAGFIAARNNNNRGIVGTAPQANLASWKIFNGASMPASFDDELAQMFQYQHQLVAVQNHSWGNADYPQLGPSALEKTGINTALNLGRNGKGVLMVRSIGNGRQFSLDGNNDGYANDPRVITVGAVDSLGNPTDYSNPGACLLITAFGGSDERALTTTDRLGTLGINTAFSTTDSSDYVTSVSVQGTSFSTPQIAGLVALLLDIRPDLTIRDVQYILALSSRHESNADPDVNPNGAGFLHSHNTGFGIPHAGLAVQLAKTWERLPAVEEQTRTAALVRGIPDDGMRVLTTGNNVPLAIRSLPSTPSVGPHADTPTAVLPLVDVGFAQTPITIDLTGKAALISRSPLGSPSNDQNTFEGKIRRAAEAGAAFAVIYNNRDLTDRFPMGGTDFSPIPAVMLDEQGGTALAAALATNSTLQTQLSLNTAAYLFNGVENLRVEHVGVRIQSTHARRGDVRITVLSPSGSRSVLQRLNEDTSAGPVSTWTYWSVHHFGETSSGTWTVDVSDEAPGTTGTITRVELVVRGTPITDSDHDGLDDVWEMLQFESLAAGPNEDPDNDGAINTVEALLGTDPNTAPPLRSSLSQLDETNGLITWNAVPGRTYLFQTAPNAQTPFTTITSITATSRTMEMPFIWDPSPVTLLRIVEQ